MSPKSRLLRCGPSKLCESVFRLLQEMDASEYPLVVSKMAVLAWEETGPEHFSDNDILERYFRIIETSEAWSSEVESYLGVVRNREPLKLVVTEDL